MTRLSGGWEGRDREASPIQIRLQWTERIIAHHTTTEQAGEVFTRVPLKLAVCSHIIPVAATANDVIPLTRKTYAGAEGAVGELGERMGGTPLGIIQ